MAITNAQQAKQMLREGGMTKKIKGQKHMLAYITPGEAKTLESLGGQKTMTPEGIPAYPPLGEKGTSPGTTTSGKSAFGGGNTNREKGITQQYKGPGGTTGSIKNVNVKDDGPKEFIGGKEFNLNPTTPEEQEQKNFAISIANDAKRVADRKKRQKDLTFVENYLGPTGFTRRTKDSNLQSLNQLSDQPKRMGLSSASLGLGIVDSFNVSPETAMFDIDSIREIYGPMSTLAGKKGITKAQTKDLKDLRQDMEIEQKILDGTLTKSEFLDYRDRNKTDDDDNDRSMVVTDPCKGPNPPPYCFIGKAEDDEEEDFQMALAFRKDGGRVGLMEGGMPYEGGIMDLESGRQMYFLGKLVKKATRAVKKIVKSPIGKIGLGALAFKFGAPLLQGSSFMKNFGFNAIKNKIGEASFGKLAGLSIGGGLLAGALAGKGYEDEDGDGFDDNTGFSVEEYRQKGAKGNLPIAFRADGGMSDVERDPQYKGWKRIYEVNPDAAEMHPKHREFVKYYASVERQGKEEGGLMNLKGMEMDFREEGGFVPIGKKERADDVPARLSKNEFVMTADAVRGMGDGNIDKGAEKMYNLMDNLEAENDQSQGLDGARKMFQTSQRLEEVL